MKESVIRSIGRLSNAIRRKLDALPFHATFSGAQGRTLHFILANSDEDTFQKDIEKEFNLRPPTATSILKDLERNGLIRKEPVPYDARLKKIVVTEKALQYKEPVMAELENLQKDAIRGIPEEDLEVFFSVVRKMLRNLS